MPLAGCTAQPDAARVSEHPTIVSLNPCADAILAEVTAPGQLLAISHYSHDPAASSMEAHKAARYGSVSGSLEEVLALDPDVVVADAFLSPATRAALVRLGIRLETVAMSGTVEESRRQVLGLARLAGNEARGRALVARIDAALPSAASARGDTALVWQAGGIVPGEGALVSDLLRRSGLASHSAARGLGQADYLPLEEVIADPPDLILAAGDPRSGENRQLSHPALAALSETERARFDPSLLWCGGPTIVRAAQRLREITR